MITVLIVDDEPPSQTELRYIINQHPDFSVVGVAGSGKEALEMLGKLNPQVAFLDIQLYDINGLDLAERITSIRKDTYIVFATAHDDFAIKAYELNAVDYVVKPFNELRIYKTLNRINKVLTLKNKQYPEINNIPGDRLERICVGDNERLSVIDCKDIVYIEAQERKTIIKIHEKSLPSFYSLKDLYTRLNQQDFLQVHRSYIVNMRYIKEIVPWFHGSYKLTMDDRQKSEIPLSRKYARCLKQRLGIIPSH